MIRMNHKGAKMGAENCDTNGLGNVPEVVTHVQQTRKSGKSRRRLHLTSRNAPDCPLVIRACHSELSEESAISCVKHRHISNDREIESNAFFSDFACRITDTDALIEYRQVIPQLSHATGGQIAVHWRCIGRRDAAPLRIGQLKGIGDFVRVRAPPHILQSNREFCALSTAALVSSGCPFITVTYRTVLSSAGSTSPVIRVCRAKGG
jgi:hypothetical protein